MSARPRPTSSVVGAVAISLVGLPLSCGARTGLTSQLPDASPASEAEVVSDASICDHVAAPIYECTPLPLDEGTCPGGPPAAGADGADASYPFGCRVMLPACDPYSPDRPLVCECMVLEMVPLWSCRN